MSVDRNPRNPDLGPYFGDDNVCPPLGSPHLPHRPHRPLPSAGGTGVVCPYPRLAGAGCPSPRLSGWRDRRGYHVCAPEPRSGGGRPRSWLAPALRVSRHTGLAGIDRGGPVITVGRNTRHGG